MSKHSRSQILINSQPGEVRVALLEGGVAQEVHIQRSNESSIVGNIYRAVVTRVMPGLQAAFVDFGSERNGFLHIDDVFANTVVQLNQHAGASNNPKDIRYLLREGQQISVQVLKQPLGEKGARLSTKLALASTYAVYKPHGSGHKISHRINAKDERARLESGLAYILDSSSSEPKQYADRYTFRSAV